MSRVSLICAGLLLILASFQAPEAQPAKEESPSGFALGPTSIKIDAQPGKSYQAKFTVVTQNTTAPSQFKIEIMDLGQDQSGSTSPIEIGKGARTAANMVTIASDLTIPPNGKKEVPFTVRVPAGSSGAYYAYIVIRLVPEPLKVQMGASVVPAATVDLSVLIKSKVQLRVDIKEVKLIYGASGSPSEIELVAQNSGTIRAAVEGDVVLHAGKGAFPTRIPIAFGLDEKPISIYPGLNVTLRAPIENSLPAGNYDAVARLLLNGEYKSVCRSSLEVTKSAAAKSIAARIQDKSEFDLDLTITPDLVELNITPGAVRSIPIQITNRDDRPASIRANIRAVNMEKNGMLTFPESAVSDLDIITVSPESLEVGPKRTATLKAMISIPRDTSKLGALVRAVHIDVSGPKSEAAWGNETEFGVLLIATDPKASPANLKIEKLELVSTSPETNPATAVVSVRNSGGKPAKLMGKINLARTTGQSIATMDIGKRQQETILAGGVREFRMPLPPVDQGKFRVLAEFATTEKNAVAVKSEQIFISYTKKPAGLE